MATLDRCLDKDGKYVYGGFAQPPLEFTAAIVSQNQWILLANPPAPKFVCPTCLL